MSLGGLSDTEIQVLEDGLMARVREYNGSTWYEGVPSTGVR